MRFLAAAGSILGLALVLIGWQLTSRPFTADDIQHLVTPVAKHNLTAGERTQLEFRIPDDIVGQKAIKALGKPNLLIAAVSGNKILCFTDLRLTIEAEVNSGRADLQPPTARDGFPYGYSAACANFGLQFDANPGDLVRLRVEERDGESLGKPKLVVIQEWSNIKDLLVGIDLSEELRNVSRVMVLIGVTLLGASAFVWFRLGRAGRLRWLQILMAVQSTQNAMPQIPRSKQYPVRETFVGKPAKPKFKNAAGAGGLPDADIRYRGSVKWSEAEGPNFAGHFTVAKWSCGTSCLSMTIVNARTGYIFRSMPLVTLETNQNPSTKDGTYAGLEFRKNSRLLIAEGCFDVDIQSQNGKPIFCGRRVYKWNSQALQLVREIPLSNVYSKSFRNLE